MLVVESEGSHSQKAAVFILKSGNLNGLSDEPLIFYFSLRSSFDLTVELIRFRLPPLSLCPKFLFEVLNSG